MIQLFTVIVFIILVLSATSILGALAYGVYKNVTEKPMSYEEFCAEVEKRRMKGKL